MLLFHLPYPWVERQHNINIIAAFDFFHELYTSTPPQFLQECLNVVPSLVSQDLNQKLESQVTSEEIKAVVFSLGDLKAPGIDGMNGLFYQKNWDVVKDSVT